MSTPWIIAVTNISTLVLIVAVWAIVKGVRGLRRMLGDFLKTVRGLTVAAQQAAAVLESVRAELAYMRQMTQAAMPQQAEAIPQPPMGRVDRMPPAFPQRDWFPDAKPTDTDTNLLEQTDQDVMEAQEREERRARGIEEFDDVPQMAVREEA